jgi:hypothetical protein
VSACGGRSRKERGAPWCRGDHFVLAPRVTPGAELRFLIRSHEEMWSFADMLEALPGLGWLYGTLFRRGFTQGFLAASQLSCRLRRTFPGTAAPSPAGRGLG